MLLGVAATCGIAGIVGLVAPGLAIAWALIATPALVRASTVIKRRREAGLAVVWEDRLHAGVASIGVALVSAIAGSAAFVAVCFPIGLPFFTLGPDPRVTGPNVGMIGAYAAGFAAAGVAGFYTMKWFWPPRAAMDDHAANPPATCPECGADYPSIGQRCWLCGAAPPDGAALPDRAAPTAGNAPENSIASSTRHTFSLISLFLVMTLVAVCLGVFAAAPGLGIVLAIVATPALVRTMIVSSRRRRSTWRPRWRWFGSSGATCCAGSGSSSTSCMATWPFTDVPFDLQGLKRVSRC
ncbi:MAG TPA: hypothetical protein VMV69_19685 [Pirellulales bacterium]|nr:hypothetical protein [Pirellulales bacterium]